MNMADAKPTHHFATEILMTQVKIQEIVYQLDEFRTITSIFRLHSVFF